jgi:hypothetical protein
VAFQNASELGAAPITTAADATGISGNVLSVTDVMIPKVAPPPCIDNNQLIVGRTWASTYATHSPKQVGVERLICDYSLSAWHYDFHFQDLIDSESKPKHR